MHGFKSFDERDLLGFADGTENPEGTDAHAATTIGNEDPKFAGGSYVVVQKYVHDLEAWDVMPVEAQERAIGRTKLSDIELPDDVRPSNSHVVINTIVDETGDKQQIVRFNMPFSSVDTSEFGTYFIGYARNPEIDRADAWEHVHRQTAGQLRPDPRLLDAAHRQPVLRPHRPVPRHPPLPPSTQVSTRSEEARRVSSTVVPSTSVPSSPQEDVNMPAPKMSFEADIKSLFREKDRDSMRRAFDLWSYADVQAHAAAIAERLKNGSMPCDGAWPPERVELFERWVEQDTPE